jgi:peptidoglycan/LPS O-acetylase OafA/YrhL
MIRTYQPTNWRGVTRNVRYTVRRIEHGPHYAFDVVIPALALSLVAVLTVVHAAGFQPGDVDGVAAIALPFLGILVYLLAFRRGIIACALSHPVLVWLGEISYAVYILHEPLWHLLSGFAAMTLHLAPEDGILFPVYLVLVVAVSGLSFQYLERPARRAIRRRWGSSKPAVAVGATVRIR